MRKIVTVFGVVIGTILCINMVFMVNRMYTNPDFKGNELIGYAAMVIVFSLIFFGVRSYRNKQLNGIISFGKAFKTGVLIALIGSTMYVVVWLVYYYLFVPDFLDKYIAYVLSATPAAELEAKTADMENFKEMYKNPLFVVLMTYAEVFPVGLIVSLVSAMILRRKG
jgi:hypothetical protein